MCYERKKEREAETGVCYLREKERGSFHIAYTSLKHFTDLVRDDTDMDVERVFKVAEAGQWEIDCDVFKINKVQIYQCPIKLTY